MTGVQTCALPIYVHRLSIGPVVGKRVWYVVNLVLTLLRLWLNCFVIDEDHFFCLTSGLRASLLAQISYYIIFTIPEPEITIEKGLSF